MKLSYVKDFVITVAVLVLLSFGIKNYYLYHKADRITEESKHKKIALSDVLLKQIQSIEQSIVDRKKFVFSVNKDPLEQNLIVKTQKDLEKQWKEEIENMVRLESTIIPTNGKKMASIAYKGRSYLYIVGDTFLKRKITNIQEGQVTYSFNGITKVMSLEKIPPKPVEIANKANNNKQRSYNW
ncbi:MAG: hypothetical protein K8S23_11885 [Candidatus Cloacimonetes bacterium]|nr:hypothetical protein [Candidatus Cloacimonadota bacterium]